VATRTFPARVGMCGDDLKWRVGIALNSADPSSMPRSHRINSPEYTAAPILATNAVLRTRHCNDCATDAYS
jgi:hypothetical protein